MGADNSFPGECRGKFVEHYAVMQVPRLRTPTTVDRLMGLEREIEMAVSLLEQADRWENSGNAGGKYRRKLGSPGS
jgi:hypothetical protein